jgi:hypothetical protein
LRLALSQGLNKAGVSFPSLKTETRQVSKTLFSVSLEFRMMSKVQKPDHSEYEAQSVVVKSETGVE